MITIKLDLNNTGQYNKVPQLLKQQYHIIALEDKYILVMRKY